MEIIEAGKIKNRYWLKVLKNILIVFIILALLGVLLVCRVQWKYRDKIFEVKNIPGDYTQAMVFGAGLRARGVPGGILEDRVMKALEIYNNGKIETIIMSGDNSSANHNEVQAMKNLAIKEGLSAEKIVLDHAGTSTFASCYRLRFAYVQDKIVLVTQRYHLARALYDCNELGVQAIGIVASAQHNKTSYIIREWGASLLDWLQVNVFHPSINLLKD